jgi:hypothetical protein
MKRNYRILIYLLLAGFALLLLLSMPILQENARKAGTRQRIRFFYTQSRTVTTWNIPFADELSKESADFIK